MTDDPHAERMERRSAPRRADERTDPHTADPRIDHELRARARRAYEQTGTVRGTARELGRSVAATHRLLQRIGVDTSR